MKSPLLSQLIISPTDNISFYSCNTNTSVFPVLITIVPDTKSNAISVLSAKEKDISH